MPKHQFYAVQMAVARERSADARYDRAVAAIAAAIAKRGSK